MTERVHKYAGGATARYWLLGAAVLLSAVGLVMIYSASSVKALAEEGVSWYYLARQVVFIVTGWAGALVLSRWDYRTLRRNWPVVWGGAMLLLGIVLLIGYASHGAQRWIPLGFFRLQPSELAKVATVIAVCAIAADWLRGRMSGRQFAARVALLTGLPALLIIVQPDMGTTVTLVAAVVIALVLLGIDWRWIIGAGATIAAVGVVFIASSSYRMERVEGFLNPWADAADTGYQSIQALYAFGTGGFDGVGLGLSRQKFFYLPEAHTDFILAIVGEEAGLIGTLAIVIGFAMLTWAGFRISRGARDDFGRLLAGALTGMLAFQAVINMAAVTGLMPVTGKPLPFVSYGGSSMLGTMIALGLLLSVSEFGTMAPRAVKVRPPAEERAREGSRDGRRDGGAHLPRADRGRPARRRA